MVVKELLFRIVEPDRTEAESTAVQTDAWHHRTDALTSIAAFIGISIALIGGPKWESADAWAALFACGLIGGERLAAAQSGLARHHGHGAAEAKSSSGLRGGRRGAGSA